MLEINCDAGFASERIEIHVAHINYLYDAGLLGKPLEAVETFLFIPFPLLCHKEENEFGAVGFVCFDPLLEASFNCWEGTKHRKRLHPRRGKGCC